MMQRRAFLKMVGACALGMAGYARGAGAERGGKRRPNIVFVFIDDMGYGDPSCFGNPSMKTPNIDRLAAEGLRLQQFYVNSPICSPSRVAVMTGQYPIRWGIHSYLESRANNRARGMANWLDAKAPTTARILKEAGYATAHFGKWHIGGGRDVGDAPLPGEYGFDESLVAFEGLGDRILFSEDGLSGQSAKLGRGRIEFLPKHKATERYMDRALAFIRKNRDKPFYIELFPNDVHDAHLPTEEAVEKWKAVTENPFEQKFFAVLEELDRQLGRLLDALDAAGLAEETLVVFTSDNGPTDWPSYYRRGWNPPGFTGPLYGRKWSLYEGGIRMPFIARWPGVVPAGAVDERTVMCGIDLSPTFCRAAGVEVPEGVRHDGEAMYEVMLGHPRQRTEPIFWQYGEPYARLRPGNPDFVSPSLAVRDGDWKLLINPDGTDAQLYDLGEDPGEQRNLLERRPEVAAELWAKIRAWAGSFGVETRDVRPTPPRPAVEMVLAGERRRLVNSGVKVRREDGGTVYEFDGKGLLELPGASAPDVGGRAVTVSAAVEAQGDDGVILAHGGDRFGYSLYLKDRRPCFVVCNDWQRTVVEAQERMGREAHRLGARLDGQGRLHLSVDGVEAEAKAGSLLNQSPGDTLQIGADLVKPVGDYTVPNAFRGTIRAIELHIE